MKTQIKCDNCSIHQRLVVPYYKIYVMIFLRSHFPSFLLSLMVSLANALLINFFRLIFQYLLLLAVKASSTCIYIELSVLGVHQKPFTAAQL